jgi:CDP-paratose 2-epimerase
LPGATIARGLLENVAGREIIGLDNLSRAGSQLNVEPLRKCGVTVRHTDLRSTSDLETLPSVDWIIDAAANPSVLAGIDGTTSSRQLIEHNLYGTVNLLEVAKRHHAGFTLLSTSRVYSVKALSNIPVIVADASFTPDLAVPLPKGVSAHGISEDFSTASRYRSTGPPSWLPNASPSNTARRLSFRFGSIVAECSRAPVNSAMPSRASSRSGLIPTCAGAR